MIFQKSIIGNSRAAKAQWDDVITSRKLVNSNEATHANMMRSSGLKVNDGLIPRDVYQEFDNVTVERMRSDDGDTYLLPLSHPPQPSHQNIADILNDHHIGRSGDTKGCSCCQHNEVAITDQLSLSCPLTR